MTSFVLGNLISLGGAIIMVLCGLIKKRKTILLVQCVQMGFLGIGNFVLGGITGTISNLICIVRNLISIKYEFGTNLKITFTVIQFFLTLFINKQGLLGWMPLVATSTFTWCLNFKKEEHIKMAIIAGQLQWALYDFFIANYTTMLLDLFTVVSNLIGIYLIKTARTKS